MLYWNPPISGSALIYLTRIMTSFVAILIAISAFCLVGIEGQSCNTNATVHVHTHFRIEEPSNVNFITKQSTQIVRYNMYWNSQEVRNACPGISDPINFPVKLVFLNAVDSKAVSTFPPYRDQIRVTPSQPTEEFIFQVFQGTVFLDVSIQLQSFPFDDQYLPMYMYLFFTGSVDDDLNLIWNVTVNDETPAIPSVKTEEPFVFSHVYNPRQERSSLEFEGPTCGPVEATAQGHENVLRTRVCAWRADRLSSQFVFGYLIPIIIFIVLLVVSFSIPFKPAVPRFAMCLFVLLIIGQYRNSVANLTSASNSQSWLDILMTCCFVIGFLSVLGQCFSWRFYEDPARGPKHSAILDRFVQMVLILFSLLSIIIACIVALDAPIAVQILFSIIPIGASGALIFKYSKRIPPPIVAGANMHARL